MRHQPHRQKPYSAAAQVTRMKARWPDFRMMHNLDGSLHWFGYLRGFQRAYKVGVLWYPGNLPYVYLIDPGLIPRDGVEFNEIPHLWFDETNPPKSGLCLFAPDGNEWSEFRLIADTTIPWAMRWLFYYELWHHDGIWRGGGVGPESVGKADAENVHSATSEHDTAPAKEA